MESFTPDDFHYLMSVPPYLCDHRDLVARYFGNDPPDHVWDFLQDLVALQKNHDFLHKRKEEEEEPSVDLLDFVNKKPQVLQKFIENLITRLESEYENRKMENYLTNNGEGGGGGRDPEKDVMLSTIIGHLHTLKIDAKVIMNALKCNVEVKKKKNNNKENNNKT